MRNFKEEYQRWLDSPALTEEEWSELNAISGDEKEIESRFFAPLEFGTAGLRGTMKVGLHHMNVHVIRHATQAFANVIAAEGEEAKRKGVAIDHDCRLNGRDLTAAILRSRPPASWPPTASTCVYSTRCVPPRSFLSP